jgi:hypothetical protein
MRTRKSAGILIGIALAAAAIVTVVTLITTTPPCSSFAGLESSDPGIHPCWSPDGSKILYSCLDKSTEFVDKRSTTAELAMWNLRSKATEKIQVGHDLRHHWDLFWPQWSDRKDRIFVTGARASGEDVPDWMTKSLIIRERLLGKSEWVVNIQTGARRELFDFAYQYPPASVRWKTGDGFALWRVHFSDNLPSSTPDQSRLSRPMPQARANSPGTTRRYHPPITTTYGRAGAAPSFTPSRRNPASAQDTGSTNWTKLQRVRAQSPSSQTG